MVEVINYREEGLPWFNRIVEGEIRIGELCIKKVATPLSHRKSEPYLSTDPRQWSRVDVCRWVEWMCCSHNLPPPNIERFLMNGKAVCLMSVNMFTARVPLGGKLLYRDFQLRLASAMHKF